MNNSFRYTPLTEEEYKTSWKKHTDIIEGFIRNNQYNPKHLYINEKTVLSVIAKVDQRKKYFQYFHGLDMSEFKEVSLICFWYIKLKPICIADETEQTRESAAFEAINEKLALYYLLRTYRSMLRKQNLSEKALDNLPDEYIKEILYSFEYRDISKEALILLVESIAVFLGLNPYQKKKEKNI